jgi:hypothetical protein
MKIGGKSKVTREVTRQEQNRKNNIKRITISAIVAFILFVALTVIQSSILNQEETLAVYQFTADIVSGSKITEDNIDSVLGIKNVQASLIPEGYITDKNEIIGKYVNRSYKAKDIITTDGLTDSEKLYTESIENPVKLAFSISGLSASVVGEIREGDYVNIYGMRNGYNADKEVVTVTREDYTFRHVLIDEAYSSDGSELKVGQSGTASVFSIIIEESDVELFNEMLNNCSLTMVKLMYDTDTNYQDYISENNESAAEASKTTTTSTTKDENTDSSKKEETAGTTESNTNESTNESEAATSSTALDNSGMGTIGIDRVGENTSVSTSTDENTDNSTAEN